MPDVWEHCHSSLARILLDESVEVSMVVDVQKMRILGVRGPVELAMNKKIEELNGQDLSCLRPHPPLARHLLTFGPTLLEVPGIYGEVAVGCGQKANRIFSVGVHPFTPTPNRPIVSIRMRDVTEQKRVDNELRRMHRSLQEAYAKVEQQQKSLDEARRAASLSQFAAGLAHEFNNPVGIAMSNMSSLDGYLNDFAKQFTDQGQLPEDIQEMKEISAETGFALLRVSNIVKSFKELETPIRRGKFDLVEVLKNRLPGASEIQIQSDPSFPMESDSNIILSLMDKLLDNARWAAGQKPGGQVRMRIERQNGHGVLTIEDDGPGLSEEWKDRVFDPFFTTRPPGEGLGLGLFLAQRAAANLGGEISIANRNQGGARVVVRLPESMPQRQDLSTSYERLRVK